MEAAMSAWLQDLAIRAFGMSLFVMLAIDGAFVNRWTSRVLAVNLVLAGTGIGVPVLALGTRLGVRVIAPLIPKLPGVKIIDEDAPPPGALGRRP